MLHLHHLHTYVHTLTQYHRLPPIAQQQYLRTVETREPRPAGTSELAHATRCLALPWCEADALRVTEHDAPDVALYDIWLIDDASDGLVFLANTTTCVGVELDSFTYDFVVQRNHDDHDGSALRLAIALNDAERFAPSDAPLVIERGLGHEKRLIGFTSEAEAPTTEEDWDALFAERGHPRISEDFVRQYGRHFGPNSWRHVWRSEKRSEAFIREFARTANDWKNIYDPGWRELWLSEELIRENVENVNWAVLGVGLSEAFMREFQDRLSWSNLSRHAVMSEAFIRDFQDRVDWPAISWFQTLSEPFIEAFAHRIDFTHLSRSETPRSIAFLQKHEDKLHWSYLAGAAPNIGELLEAFPHRIDPRATFTRPRPTELIQQHAANLDWSQMLWLKEDQARLFADRVHWAKLACARWEPWVETLLRENEHRVDEDDWNEVLNEGRISLAYKNELRVRRAQRRASASM